MDPGAAAGGDKGRLCLQIDTSTIFDPRFSVNTINTPSPTAPSGPIIHAPEKKLTLFALQLAVLEKAATEFGALGFIWATVVLLGGFAVDLTKTDFWFVTIILLIEGARILSRSHELEWQQHEATWSIAVLGRNSVRAIRSSSMRILQTVKRTGYRHVDEVQEQSQHSSRKGRQLRLPTRKWETSEVPILPFFQRIFLSKNVSKLLYWLQLASATACMTLSLMQLIKHDFPDADTDLDKENHNRNEALVLFYSLALAEALLFLMETAYWRWKVIHKKLFEEVNKECELGPLGIISVTRFFYDAYSRCINGSIFDGLNMDMVSFAMDLLALNSPDEQLIGIRVLHSFSTNKRFSDDTLQKIGITLPVMERLVDMLNWKNLEEDEIRTYAAEILSKLAGKKQNALRVSGIPGAMESVSSLLQNHRMPRGAGDEIHGKIIIQDNERYSLSNSNHLGLLILKKLARDHDNCAKMGSTRGLLPKIIAFTQVGERFLKDESVTPCQINTVKRSLQVLKMLASTTGTTGKQLRTEISEEVFIISNIRDILKYGEKWTELQKIGIQILTNLAMEARAAEMIGGTGGVLKELFNILFKQGMPGSHHDVRIAAGEALAMLTFESKSNGHRVLKLKVTERLIKELEVPVLRINAARILTNLCIYVGAQGFMLLREVIDAAPTVLRAIMSAEQNNLTMSEENKFLLMTEENKLQEVMVGLAANVFKFLNSEASSIMFERAGIQEAELAKTVIQILRNYQNPAIKTPRIRRFVVELATWMMRHNETTVHIFKDLGMIKEMESVIETTSELENFNVFSGTFGMSRHSTTIHLLVETAMKLLKTSNLKPRRLDISQ